MEEGIWVEEIQENGQVIEKFADRIRGRFPVRDIVDPATGEVLCPKDRMLSEADAKVLEAHGITKVEIRTVLTLPGPQRRVRPLLRHEPGLRPPGGHRRGCRHHRRPVHR